MAALNIIIILSLCWIAAVQAGVEHHALKEHNRLRALHGSPPLKLSAKLNALAKAYAKKLAKLGDLVHSKTNYGESLCAHYDHPEKCSQIWYDEIKDYDYNKPEFSMATGHFTQLVWKASRLLGYGQAKGKVFTYVVAMYDPSGNYEGQFDKEVPRLLKDRRGGSEPKAQL